MKRFNEFLIKRIGGWQVILAVAISQVIGLLGAIPGLVSIRLNVELNEDLSLQFSNLLPILFIVSQILLLAICWWFTPSARKRLTDWSNGNLHADTKKEFMAWREITNITTRFGTSAFIINFIFLLLPPFFITLSRLQDVSSVFQPTSISSPVPFYILLGGLASILGFTILATLLAERFTTPSRLVLLPKNFEDQLNGRAGTRLGIKFQILILGLIIISVASVATIGYQQTVRIIYSEISSMQAFSDLRAEIFFVSMLVLLLGIGFSYFATHSVSDPLKEFIQILQKIEKGDLTQRVPVSATDELATVAMHFNHMVTRLDELQSTLEQRVSDRTKQLTATNEVGRVASSILDPDELIGKVTNLIAEELNYYYAAIYLLDPSDKWAELKEATGQAGYVLKQNRHRLELTGKSMVATCIRERKPRIAQNTAEEKQRFENPLLPYTRSEIALPLFRGDYVLGALNVQSTKAGDFDADAITTMQNMANQVAIALENARLFQEAQQSIKELHAIQKQYLLEGWTSMGTNTNNLEYSIGEPSNLASQTIQSPIGLRDQIFGQLTLEGNEEWTPEQQSLVDAVTTQAAIALENARLVSESRQIALRERMLSEINSKIWASTSIDGILQTVVKELGRRLDTSNATIELHLGDES